MNWTESQLQAIEEREKNILVSAAAGSGKTAVLVERIKQLIIKDRVSIDKMLIVTFTNAAAAEMRERISNAISEELEKSQDHFLRDQLNRMNRGNISTFHSFCIEVIREYFYLIDLEPDFKICDDAQKYILQEEALEQLLEKEFENKDDAFMRFADCYATGRDEDEIKNMILYTFNFIQSTPKPFEWLKEKVEELNRTTEAFRESSVYQRMVGEISSEIKKAKHMVQKAWTLSGKPAGPFSYLSTLEEDLQKISHFEDMFYKDERNLKALLEALEFSRLPVQKGDEIDIDLKEGAKKLRNHAKNIVTQLKNNYQKKSIEVYVEELIEVYPYAQKLYDLVEEFEKIFSFKKREKNVMDFNDLEHFALKILGIETVAQGYQNKFEFLFIDEYQDSNIVQETLIDAIKRNNNVFMVGDVKQSIYRFRLADPLIFLNKYEAYKTNSMESNTKIDLNLNYRSKKHIIFGTNYIFKNLMSKNIAEIEYDQDAYLYKGLQYHEDYDYPIELNLIDYKEPEGEDIDETIREMKKVEIEALVAAQKIKKYVGTELFDCKNERKRPMTYKDMVILLRTVKEWMNIYYEILLQEDIPVYMDAGEGYFETIEVSIFLNLIALIDNKKQDIPLLSVLRSPVGGFTTDEIIKIRLYSNNKFYNAFERYACEAEDVLADKSRLFLEKINKWKKKSTYLQVDDFLWSLLKETGYQAYISALPGGIQRQANLKMLIEKAKQFRNTTMKGLFDFLKFMEQVKRAGSGMNTAKVIGENDDVVRIMSIHKSKGLEFPLVIVGGMGKAFNRRSQLSKVALHKDIGVGMRLVDPDISAYVPTLYQKLINKQQHIEAISEEMRILYVAFTRAQDRLILLGTVSDLDKYKDKWMIYDQHHIQDAACYLDWLIPILKEHKECGCQLNEALQYQIIEEDCYEDASRWLIERKTKKDLNKIAREQSNKKEEIQKSFVKGFPVHKVNHPAVCQLDWSYDFKTASRIPSKLSVTEIRNLSVEKMKYDELDIPKRTMQPAFIEDSGSFSAMERGTIMHQVMQHISIKKTQNMEQIMDQIKEMKREELLTKDEAATIKPQKIMSFFQSEIGTRMKKSDCVFREIPFNILKPAKSVIKEIDDEENLLIQGTIDCFFQEGNKYILLDYKNDYIPPEMEGSHVNRIIQKYTIQLDLYKEALEIIKGIEIKEVYLYLFDIERAIKIN